MTTFLDQRSNTLLLVYSTENKTKIEGYYSVEVLIPYCCTVQKIKIKIEGYYYVEVF